MIGIVGGAGPAAGADLLRKIIDETQAATDQDHLPVVLWSEPAVIPDRTEFLKGKVSKNPAGPISKLLLKLEENQVSTAAIACNTAHDPVIFNEIIGKLKSASSKLTVLNIIDETVNFLKANYSKGALIGLLSTTGIWERKTYANAIENHGFKVVRPKNSAEQNQIHQAVYNKEYGIKGTGLHVSKRAYNILCNAVEKLVNRGAEGIVLGCTELPMAITNRTISGVRVIDATRVLARALINQAAPEKLKNIS